MNKDMPKVREHGIHVRGHCSDRERVEIIFNFNLKLHGNVKL